MIQNYSRDQKNCKIFLYYYTSLTGDDIIIMSGKMPFTEEGIQLRKNMTLNDSFVKQFVNSSYSCWTE